LDFQRTIYTDDCTCYGIIYQALPFIPINFTEPCNFCLIILLGLRFATSEFHHGLHLLHLISLGFAISVPEFHFRLAIVTGQFYRDLHLPPINFTGSCNFSMGVSLCKLPLVLVNFTGTCPSYLSNPQNLALSMV
jgi:hypothetical protein